MAAMYEMKLEIEVVTPRDGRTILTFPGRYIRFESSEYASFDADDVVQQAMKHIRDAVESTKLIDRD